MESIMVKAVGQGLWCALFIWLLVYILKKQEIRDTKSELRESTYQNIITDLTNNLQLITVIGSKVDKIEELLRK
ncbi:hypothetical protein LGL08_20615 [Clostridium estertheticum]|uniref:BhlA/UviB family holin-like peptide n=1 Tax=Clostridium estertheticum TaxID=238834 RepID=UPI001CF5764A|nr:BhlA/UviB family holin-like peptide [Clostridium estertheticum]MCB2308888.1 hypothetical protein [Clostridium estertheticum]MCB2347300.1 hypothetical protein [Clostridium estertheticum]MCB2351933.1 hypothetical protein [Clostridium estertheticum]WAG48501.1 hypothetical protein LL127_23185 [Clostridium estertheticum]